MNGLKKDSVERTLCIPLWSRAIAVRKLPQILPDHDAVKILEEMGEKKPPTVFYNLECAALAGAIRQYDLACEINEYLKERPDAVIVELGAGLSCLRRQMNNETNDWINIDLEDVNECRNRYIPLGEKERNVAFDITDHKWFKEIPFKEDKGAIFLAAGVLHYLSHKEVSDLISAMASEFPGSVFVFDYVSKRGAGSGNAQISMTGNDTRISFSMEDAEKEIPVMSDRIASVTVRSYLEGYPIKDAHYSLLTKLYIRSKRKKYFIARTEFKRSGE